MGAGRTGIIGEILVVRDTEVIGGGSTDHPGGLADTVAVDTVVTGNRAVGQAGARVAGTGDAVGSPHEGTGLQVAQRRTGVPAGGQALVVAVALVHLVGAGRTGIIGGKGVVRETEVTGAGIADHPGGLADTVGIGTVVTGNRAGPKTGT